MNTAASPSLESGMDGEDIAMVAYAHQVGGGGGKKSANAAVVSGRCNMTKTHQRDIPDP